MLGAWRLSKKKLPTDCWLLIIAQKMKKILYISLFLNFIVLLSVVLAIINIGSPRYLFYLLKNRGQGIVSLKKSKTSHLKTLTQQKGQIVMLGNSITAECEWAELLDNPHILNRGVIADGTEDILNRLDNIIELEPRKIFLLIGVNDLLFLPPNIIMQNYESIVARIRNESPQTILYLESILPIHNDLRRNGMKNEDIVAINQMIKSLADKYQLVYIDAHSRFTDTEGALRADLTFDGIHLNGEGYQIFKPILQPYMAQ